MWAKESTEKRSGGGEDTCKGYTCIVRAIVRACVFVRELELSQGLGARGEWVGREGALGVGACWG